MSMLSKSMRRAPSLPTVNRGLREACVCSLRNNQISSGEPGRVCRGGQEYGEHEPPKVCVLSGQTKAMNEGVKMGGCFTGTELFATERKPEGTQAQVTVPSGWKNYKIHRSKMAPGRCQRKPGISLSY